MLWFQSEGSLLPNSLLLREGKSFTLFKASVEWVNALPITEGNLLKVHRFKC